MSLMRTLGMSLLVLGLSGCPFLFSFDRANELEPGDIRGVAVNADTGEPIPFARVSYADGQRRARADTDGEFVLRGLSEGTWVLRLTQDDVAPFGEPERLAVRHAVIRTVPLGLLGGEQKEFVDLGRIELAGPGSVSGVVRAEDGTNQRGATAIGFRRLLASVDAFDNPISNATQVTSTEATRISNSAGEFTLPNLAATVPGESEFVVLATYDPGDDGQTQCFVSDPVSTPVVANADTTLPQALQLRPAAAFDGNLRVRFDPPQPNVDVSVTILASGTPPGLTTGEGCAAREVTSDAASFIELGDLSQLIYDDAVADCAPAALRACDLVDIYVRIERGDELLRGALFGVVVGQSAGTVELAPVAVAETPCFPSPGGLEDDVSDDCDADNIFRFPDESLTDQTFFNVVEYCNGVCTVLQDAGQTGQNEFVCDLEDDAAAGLGLPSDNPNLADAGPNDLPWRTRYDCDDDDDGEIDFTEPWCAGLPAGQVSELCGNDIPETDGGMPDPDAGSEDAGVVDAGPRPIPTLPDLPAGAAASVSAGDAATCAAGADDQVWCWGHQERLGLGEPAGSRRYALPVPMNGAVVDLDVGGSHACAITDDETTPVLCWGSNTFGQVGTPIDTDAPLVGEATVLEAGLLYEPGGAVAIAAGARHTCAVVGDADRQVVCWGDNSANQLGSTAAGPVEAGDAVGVDEPEGIDGVWSDVAAGGDFTLALTSDGRVFCWGGNASGQCGQGAGADPALDAPTEVIIDAEGPWVQITAGGAHACARNLFGDVACWGDNSADQLGRGGDTAVPGLTPTLAASVEAGAQHTCILTDGGEALHCWGDNGDGQLGDGTSGSTSATPVTAISGDAPLYAIAAGSGHTCALSVDEDSGEHAPCWGDNVNDQLGHGDASLTPSPSGLPRKSHAWLGTTSGEWEEATNWSSGLVPGPADAALLDGRGDTAADTPPASLTVGTLIVRASYGANFAPAPGSETVVNGSLLIEAGQLQMTDEGGASSLTVAPVTGGRLEIVGASAATTLVSDGASTVKLQGTTGALDLTTPRPTGRSTSRTELALPADGTGSITLRGTTGYDDVIVFTEETFETLDVTLDGDSVELVTSVGGGPSGWIIDGDFTFAPTAGTWSFSTGLDLTISGGAVTVGNLIFAGNLDASAASAFNVVGLFILDPLGSVSFGPVDVTIASTGGVHLLPTGDIYNNVFALSSGAELGLASGVRVNDVSVDAPTGPATIVSLGEHPLTPSPQIGGLAVTAGSELALEGQLQVDIAAGTVLAGSTLTINAHPSSFVEFLGGLTVAGDGTVNVDGLLVLNNLDLGGEAGAPSLVRARDGGRIEINGVINAAVEGTLQTDAGGTVAFGAFTPQNANISNDGDIEVGSSFDIDVNNVVTGNGTFTLATEAATLNFDGRDFAPTLRIPPGADYFKTNIDVGLSFASTIGLLVEAGARLVVDSSGDGSLQLHTVTVYGALELLGADYTIDDGLGAGQLTVGPTGDTVALDGTLRAGFGSFTLNGTGTIAGDARFDGRDNFLDVSVNGPGLTVADGGEVQGFDANFTIGASGQPPGSDDSTLHVAAGGEMTVNGTFFGEGSAGELSVYGLLHVEGTLSLPTVAGISAWEGTCQLDGGLLEIGLEATCGTFRQSGGTFLAPRRRLRVLERFEVTGGTFEHRRGEIYIDVAPTGSTLDLPAAPQLYALTVEDVAVSSVTVTNGSRLNVEGPLKLMGTSDGATPFDTADGTGFWELNASGPRLVQEAFIRHAHNVHSTNMRVDPVTVIVDADSAANGWGATCGNGILELPEQCDDGNVVDTDFCLNSCALNTAFSGGDVCTWVGGGGPGNWGNGGFWTGGGLCGETGPGPSDVAIFDGNATGVADLFFGTVNVDTLIIRANVPPNAGGAAVRLNSGASLTVNHLLIEGCADGCPQFHGIRVNGGGRLVVNQTASVGGGIDLSGGRLQLRGHSDLSSAVFSSSTGTVELVSSDVPSTWDGQVTTHGHAPTLQGSLDFLTEGDAAAEMVLDGVFDRFSNISVRADGEVNDLLQPLTVRTSTGALLGTGNLNLFVSAAGITAGFDPGISIDTSGLNSNLDTATIPVAIDGRLRISGYENLFSFPHVGELVMAENAGIDFEDQLFFVGATVGDVVVEPYASLGSYNYGNIDTSDDHVIDGDLILFGALYPESAGVIVNGELETLSDELYVLSRVTAERARFRYGDVRSPEALTLRDGLAVSDGVDFDHACGVITQRADASGFALDVDGQDLWQVNLSEDGPVTFAADTNTTILHGMTFTAAGGSFVSSAPGTTYRLDARGDLQVSAMSYTDAVGVGPGYVASAGDPTNSTRIVAPPTCGDGTLDASTEECDDGDNLPGNGCSAVCTVEPNFTCDGTGCVAAPDVCGDGIVGPTEACDIGSRCQQSGNPCVTNQDCNPFGGELCLPNNDFLCTNCVIGGQSPDTECFGCPSVCYDPAEAG